MPKKRKVRSFYIDTNVALDYATRRDIQTILVLEKIKERRWKCVSSTFLAMEMADYQKNALFISDAMAKKWEVRKILNHISTKTLSPAQLDSVGDFFEDFKNQYKKIQMYDFLQDSFAWEVAQDISFSSNLTAPDVIHLTSAIVGAIGGYCSFFITKDGLLLKEAKKIIERYRLKTKLKVMTIAEVKKKFFTS
ncbi:hypothetical protein ES707_16923 [subsurface metagenome]